MCVYCIVYNICSVLHYMYSTILYEYNLKYCTVLDVYKQHCTALCVCNHMYFIMLHVLSLTHNLCYILFNVLQCMCLTCTYCTAWCVYVIYCMITSRSNWLLTASILLCSLLINSTSSPFNINFIKNSFIVQ